MIRQSFNNGTHLRMNLRIASPDIKINHQSPPAVRNLYSSPLNNNAPQYLMHLIPQQAVNQSSSIQMLPRQSMPFQINSKQSQFIENQNKQSMINKQSRFSSEAKQMIKIVTNPNISSMVTCASGASFSPQKGIKDGLISAHNMEYMQPKPPTIVKRDEPIRRISQYKTNISQISEDKSSKSTSQHNYHITIETSSDNNSSVPKITISPGHDKSQQNVIIHKVNPSLVQSKQVINRQPIVIEQRSSTTQMPQPYFGPQLQQSQFVNHHQIGLPTINNPPTIINHHHHPILIQQQPKQSEQISFKTILNSQVPVASLKSDTNIFKKQQTLSSSRREYSNDYYNNYIEQSPSRKKQSLNAYIQQQNIYFNSRKVINEIFENETNKALLRMSLIESKSRQRSIRSLKKYQY